MWGRTNDIENIWTLLLMSGTCRAVFKEFVRTHPLVLNAVEYISKYKESIWYSVLVTANNCLAANIIELIS